MKKLVALIIIAFIGYQCIHAMNRKRAAESQEESNKRARTEETVTLLTSDGHEISVPKKLAEKSSFLAGIIESTTDSDEPIPLPRIDRAEIVPIISMLKALDEANQAHIKPDGERYIAQRIQPIINRILQPLNDLEIAFLVRPAYSLDLGYLANGIIRVLVEKTFAAHRHASLDAVLGFWHEGATRELSDPFGILPTGLIKIVEYHYQLVRNGNIPELSIADYIAIHGMPQMRFDDLDLISKQLTSIEGLRQIPDIENVDRIYLNNNKILQLPAHAWQGLINLRTIDLHNNLLTELPPTLFQGLQRLEYIIINSNHLATLPALLFQNLTRLKKISLEHNRLRELPATLFQGLINLETLLLEHNRLAELPENIFQGLNNLRILDVSHNRLTRLPATLFACSRLYSFEFARGNQFTEQEKRNIRNTLEGLSLGRRARRRLTMWGDQF